MNMTNKVVSVLKILQLLQQEFRDLIKIDILCHLQDDVDDGVY